VKGNGSTNSFFTKNAMAPSTHKVLKEREIRLRRGCLVVRGRHDTVGKWDHNEGDDKREGHPRTTQDPR